MQSKRTNKRWKRHKPIQISQLRKNIQQFSTNKFTILGDEHPPL